MRVEQLRMDNLREGIHCGELMPFANEWYMTLEAWLDGGMLRGQIARTDDGEAIGFVLYYPIEKVPMEIDGDGFYMVQCLQVKPPHDKGVVARLLIESAIADAQESGATGIVAEGLTKREPRHDHVTATLLESLGLVKGESRGFATIYYLIFEDNVEEPRYMPASFMPPQGRSRLRVDIMDCRLCYVGIHNRETVMQAVERSASEMAEVVVHDQNTREAVLEKGYSAGVFIDGKLTYFRGPVTEDEVLQAIDVADAAREREIDR
jgi:GNAT superfamily N-acetyltransferase